MNLMNFFCKILKKCLPSEMPDVIISDVVTLIAMKREVAARLGQVFPWSEGHVLKTGDKSLYNIIFCFWQIKRVKNS